MLTPTKNFAVKTGQPPIIPPKTYYMRSMESPKISKYAHTAIGFKTDFTETGASAGVDHRSI